jgi:hypothetical protein
VSDEQITVWKSVAVVPVVVLGQDEQGRQLVRCPALGCGETATVEADGSIVCPVGKAEQDFLQQQVGEALQGWVDGI